MAIACTRCSLPPGLSDCRRRGSQGAGATAEATCCSHTSHSWTQSGGRRCPSSSWHQVLWPPFQVQTCAMGQRSTMTCLLGRLVAWRTSLLPFRRLPRRWGSCAPRPSVWPSTKVCLPPQMPMCAAPKATGERGSWHSVARRAPHGQCHASSPPPPMGARNHGRTPL